MNRQNIHLALKSDYSKLPLILALAFFLAFIPHYDYPYLVHLDEWMHLTRFEALLQAQSITFIDPLYGGPEPALVVQMETGFYLFWAVFYKISGIPWLTIFKYFPGIIFVITVLSVYILARRQGFGWEAAFFCCLIPTTVGILGPGFLVPVALGLLFIPLSLFVAFNLKSGWAYAVLFIFNCFLLSMHAATAVGLVIILIPYILLNVKGKFKHSLGITLALVIPFLLLFSRIFELLLPTLKSLFSPQPLLSYVSVPPIIPTYGYLPVMFCLLGASILAIRGGKKDHSLVLSFLALLAMLAIYFTAHYGLAIVYYRGLLYMMLMMSIVAGAGLMGLKNVTMLTKLADQLKVPVIVNNVGTILCLIFISLILAISIPYHMGISYYHMIDEKDYEAFTWIRENVGDEYEKGILDPWKATAFTAITGKPGWARIGPYPHAGSKRAYEFLEEGCIDTALLREKGISIVYTQGECYNPDLVKVRENIYLLEEDGEGD